MNIIQRIKKCNDELRGIQGVDIGEFIVSPPTSNQVLDELETKLEYKLPVILRDFYLNQASSVSFSWMVGNQDVFGRDCTYGKIQIPSPYELLDLVLEMKGMVQEAIQNSEELATNEGLRALVDDWEYWIPISIFTNGDAFCISTKKDGEIVFLEHDVMDGGPNIHGLKIANNFDDLINKWSKVAFVDIYDWSKGTNDEGIDLSNIIYSKLLSVIKE